MLDPDNDRQTIGRVLTLHDVLFAALGDNAKCVGDAMAAIGMLANETFRQVDAKDRLHAAEQWAQLFVHNVRASLGKYDA